MNPGDGSFSKVDFVPGTLVVNIGDCLQHWMGYSGNRDGEKQQQQQQLVSSVHRVTAPAPCPLHKTTCRSTCNSGSSSSSSSSNGTDKDNDDGDASNGQPDNSRHSVAYFVGPNYGAVMVQPTWPRVDQGADDTSSSNSYNSGGSSVSYSNWRKTRIKQATRARLHS